MKIMVAVQKIAHKFLKRHKIFIMTVDQNLNFHHINILFHRVMRKFKSNKSHVVFYLPKYAIRACIVRLANRDSNQPVFPNDAHKNLPNPYKLCYDHHSARRFGISGMVLTLDWWQ